jgi:nanoRNase/pAp phosphatase (c-di-AMP/oligoRNAs hydrolase)
MNVNSIGFREQAKFLTNNKDAVAAQTSPIATAKNVLAPLQKDVVSFNNNSVNVKKAGHLAYAQKGKEAAVVSFKGLGKPEAKPGLQMKVEGVMTHQRNMFADASERQFNKTRNINRLADSNWKDGQKLNFKFAAPPKSAKKGTPDRIVLSDPRFGEIGRVPQEIAAHILPVIQKDPENFQFELSNLISGMSKGASTIGMRVNVVYNGQDEAIRKEAAETFEKVLNSDECKNRSMAYQPASSPMEVMSAILKYERKHNGSKVAEEMKGIVKNIVKELDAPENKNILIIGHAKPDGDTIGSILGLKGAIGLAHPDKNVDMAINDDIPGLFRDKIPGIEDIKRAADPNKKYDLVVFADTPTPGRATNAFKDQVENANKVIYIDHHPHRIDEWEAAKGKTGIDMKKIHKDGLAWISEHVSAGTLQVGVIAAMLNPKLDKVANGELKASDVIKTKEQKAHLESMVAGLVTGTSTDTGSFTRGAHVKAEGFAKWLMSLTPDTINKKWLRENVTYDIDDFARSKMVDVSINSREIRQDLGLGIMSVTHDDIQDVFALAKEADPATTLLDVGNSFKYSEALGALRSAPFGSAPVGNMNYRSDNPEHDKSRIAVLMTQEKKGNGDNSIRMSFRAADGKDWAKLLANLFGGGGHGAAAGGGLSLPGLEYGSRLAVKIDGKVEEDSAKILKTLKENDRINAAGHPPIGRLAQIEIVQDNNGRTVSEIIQDVVVEIRNEEAKPAAAPKATEKVAQLPTKGTVARYA